MTNKNLSIHIESGDIFYQNFNTGKNFSILYFLNMKISQPQYLKKFHTITVLKSIHRTFYFLFQLMMSKKLIYMPIKMRNICSVDLMVLPSEKRQTIKHTIKVNNSIGLKKTEERDQQFLVEKIIYCWV